MPPLGSGDTMDMDALALALSNGNDLPLPPPPPTGEGEINDGRDGIGRAIVDDDDDDAGVAALGIGSNNSDDGTRDNDVGVVGMDRGGVMSFSGTVGVVADGVAVVVVLVGDGMRTIGVRYPSGLSQKNPTMRL